MRFAYGAIGLIILFYFMLLYIAVALILVGVLAVWGSVYAWRRYPGHRDVLLIAWAVVAIAVTLLLIHG